MKRLIAGVILVCLVSVVYADICNDPDEQCPVGISGQQCNQRKVRARQRQGKRGLEYEAEGPWWPNDPRYPVPYLFYREGQYDFGFGRW